MQDIKVHVEYEEIARALAQSKTEAKWYCIENLLRVAQLASIIGIGIAGVFMYFSFERQRNDVSLALLTAQTQQEKLQLVFSELTIIEKSIQLQKATHRQISIDHEIEVRDVGPHGDRGEHLFQVTYNWDFTNGADVAHEVTYFTVAVFTASITPDMISPVLEVNTIDQKGSVKWKFQFGRGFYYKPKWTSDIRLSSKGGMLVPDRGGGGTARLNPKESSCGAMEILVVGNKMDWIGVIGQVGIDGATTAEDRWDVEYTAALNEGTEDAQQRPARDK